MWTKTMTVLARLEELERKVFIGTKTSLRVMEQSTFRNNHFICNGPHNLKFLKLLQIERASDTDVLFFS
jgi:hypothetical protein